MEKKVKYRAIFLCLISLVFLMTGIPDGICGQSKKAEALLNDANRHRKRLYASEKKKKFRHNWLNCIGRYERIYGKYPKSDQAQKQHNNKCSHTKYCKVYSSNAGFVALAHLINITVRPLLDH